MVTTAMSPSLMYHADYLLKLELEEFDVKTTFLYGDLDKEIWMDFPEGHVEYLKRYITRITTTQTGVWNSERPYTVWYKLHDSGGKVQRSHGNVGL
jgi:hypothetical protein